MFIKILVVDDHKIFRGVVCQSLGVQKDMRVIGEAGDGKQGVEMTRKLKPDIVMMDISMPVLNGIEATRQIKAEFPETQIIALTASSEPYYVEKMFDSGASEYLNKTCGPKALVNCIRKVSQDRLTFDHLKAASA